jgi:hypothetical protein
LKQIEGNDPNTSYWIKETTRLIAIALREKKKWIITPKSDTNVHFKIYITNTFLCIINDNWDALERAEGATSMVSQSPHPILMFLLSLLKLVFLMGLPIAIFLVFQQAPFVIPDTVRGYIIIGLFLWELLTLLVVFDPNVNAKISAIKDLTNLLPSNRDSKL